MAVNADMLRRALLVPPPEGSAKKWAEASSVQRGAAEEVRHSGRSPVCRQYQRGGAVGVAAGCIALAIHRVRQRLAVQIWRDYQDHLTARIRFADPDEDDKRRHEEEARVDAEEQELAARRLFNEAYLQRMGRPQAFGLG